MCNLHEDSHPLPAAKYGMTLNDLRKKQIIWILMTNLAALATVTVLV